MLERWMPFGTYQAANPVFRFGVRRLRWGRTSAALNRRSLIVSFVTFVILLALWLLLMVSSYNAASCATLERSYCYYPVSRDSAAFTTGLALLTVGFDVLLDLACILAGYNTMRMSSEATHWDLLRMTPMRVQTIVDAQHAVAQTRAWLMTALLTALRITAVVLYLLTFFGLPIAFRGGLGDLIGFGFDFNWLFTLVALLIVAFVFMAEPLWRMRAMTALGVALAARLRDPVMGTLAALGSVLGLWLVELILLGIMFAMTLWVGQISWFFAPVFGAILGGIVIRVFFRVLADRSLGRAVRHVTPG